MSTGALAAWAVYAVGGIIVAWLMREADRRIPTGAAYDWSFYALAALLWPLAVVVIFIVWAMEDES